MIQGTTSDAGKSVMTAGLCRLFAREGFRVVPFKPQNMALNSAVTVDGGEIGRAQAVQAQACFLQPHSDMNPVLLKPNTDKNAQIILHGKAQQDMNALIYHQYKPVAMRAVLASHERLKQQYEMIICEGAGSPAEINLRDGDIANMGFAESVDCPVILVADIDRGGVFAHLCGTLDLLSPSEQQRVIGFVINKFRGDLSILQPGLDWLESRTGKPVLGVVPYLHGFHLEAEDAINAFQVANDSHANTINVIAPIMPRISNHTDFDVLRYDPQVNFQFVQVGDTIPPADLIILPGSKSVRSDLAFLCEQGWPAHIQKHLRYGGKLLGICGGFQMLGHRIHDPLGIEGYAGDSEGLKLLDFETELKTEKQLHRVSGTLCGNNQPVTGYEIHAGISQGPALAAPFVDLGDRVDGALSADGLIAGTYLHGLFDTDSARKALLHWAGLREIAAFDYRGLQEQQLDRLADCLKENLRMDLISPWIASAVSVDIDAGDT